jgi:hypothetical protein
MVLVGDCARRWGRRARRAVSVRAVARVDAREVLISSQLCRPAHENTRDGGSGGHAGNQEIKVESTAVRGLPVCCPWAVWSGEFWAQADGWAVQSQRRTWTVRSNWPQRNERDTQQRQPRCCARLGVCEVKKLRECEGGLQVAWKRDKVCQGQRKSTAPRNCTGPCKCSTWDQQLNNEGKRRLLPRQWISGQADPCSSQEKWKDGILLFFSAFVRMCNRGLRERTKAAERCCREVGTPKGQVDNCC